MVSILIGIDRVKVKWYVIFTRTDTRHWVYRFISPRFQHCYAVQRSKGGQFWIKMDCNKAVLQIDLVLVDDYPEIACFCEEGDIIVPVTAVIKDRFRGSLCWFTCVEVVKAALGIKAPLVITPFQLYKRLQDERFTKG